VFLHTFFPIVIFIYFSVSSIFVWCFVFPYLYLPYTFLFFLPIYSFLLITVTGWYRTKCPCTTAIFRSSYYASPSEFKSLLIYSPVVSGCSRDI
jgi:hypothetical protein